jgi:Mrp family chromosome partitioning ATPase
MIVMVIASAEGDGTSTMALNLARALAEDGYRTALVAADLLPPQASRVAPDPGKERERQAGTAAPDFTKLALVDLLAAGKRLNNDRPPAPNEVLLKAVFTELSSKFDFIVLDSPPLPGVADGMTLGGYAHMILSVITLSKTRRRSFSNHLQLLAVLGRLHGVIINQAIGPVPYKSRRRTITGMLLRR